MSYDRVIPRDLFNDANLLKCVGKLCLLIDDGKLPFLSYEFEGDTFEIEQNPNDGSTYVSSITFYYTGAHCEFPHVWRPLNSKESWPLILTINDSEFQLFDENGDFALTDLDLFKLGVR